MTINDNLYDLIVVQDLCIYKILNALIDLYGPDSRIYRESVCILLNQHKQKKYKSKEEFDIDYKRILNK